MTTFGWTFCTYPHTIEIKNSSLWKFDITKDCKRSIQHIIIYFRHICIVTNKTYYENSEMNTLCLKVTVGDVLKPFCFAAKM
jgi:hypothetical protein